MTKRELLKIQSELQAREPIFHRCGLGTSRADFEAMIEPTFWEVGASGRIYTREFVLDELERRFASPHEDNWEARDFQCSKIAEDNYLLTYTLLQGNRVTRRATIWRQSPQGWKIVYHQGTVVQDP